MHLKLGLYIIIKYPSACNDLSVKIVDAFKKNKKLGSIGHWLGGEGCVGMKMIMLPTKNAFIF